MLSALPGQMQNGAPDAELSIVTVIRPLSYAYTRVKAASFAQAMLNFEQQAEVSTRARLNELGVSVGVVKDHMHVVFGVPGQTIRSTAASIGADLTVIGSHGRHGLGLLLGSTANAVLHGVQRGVLTVCVQD
ncbi:MAG: universal stress protein [Pseudomonadales bacterium]|jgi:universal stress protein A|nr:universal stress protein [Pseudomonadales bacterium]MDP6472765.1 universal stress protein [Pseudomonadales bacterium]MDP6827978.1 universal stress protein [Pseudomonadales bacterium]MDP6972877.1 universal stress protein [Pseudomonadales bacterium]|tara:strand:+ start:3896 stop:4291 length:396 start_codon:yes stop_codon:yes gene_type:complete